MQAPEIQDQRRRHAEVDEVGEAVELGAEARRALEHPGDAAVYAVEERGEDDGGEREVEPALDRHADRRQPGADRQQRDEIRHQHAHGHGAETAAPRLGTLRTEGAEWHGDKYTCFTVAPPRLAAM